MTLVPTTIDLYWQDEVTSFTDIRSAGIERIIHKATDGVSGPHRIDSAYASRLPQALAAGLTWDAYLFWHDDDPQALADNFLDVIHGAAAQPYQCWLDYEESGGTPSNIMAVMEAVNEGIGGMMGLYGPPEYIDPLIAAATDEQKAFFGKAPLWWAEYGVHAPRLSAAVLAVWPKGPDLWQYTETGKIAGVSGACDLNCVPEAA